MHKIFNRAKHHHRQRRDYHREESPPRGSAGDSWLGSAGKDPGLSPDEEACFAETMQQFFSVLDEPARRVALRKIEGFTDDEIARELECSSRTVMRRKELIRQKWKALRADTSPT